MLLRQVRRFISPPKCLELDTLNLPNEDSLFLQRNEIRDSQKAPIYIIRQNGAGRGLFSLVSAVVCHLHLAARHGLRPIVDLRNLPTEYGDAEFMEADPWRRTNPWDFYFEPVSELGLDPDCRERVLLASGKAFPSGYPRKMLISHVQELRDIAATSIRPAADLAQELKMKQAEILENHCVLGVHIRGQEQKTMPYHPLSPNLAQIYAAIDMALAYHPFTRIFIASEDRDYVDAVEKRYPEMAVAMPHFRTRSPINAYRIYPRARHKYLLGKEILLDAFILSACHGLVSSTSNVTEFARAHNNGQYVLDLVIDNGLNATNPFLAKHLWGLKNRLPESLGGFSVRAIQPFPSLEDSPAGS